MIGENRPEGYDHASYTPIESQHAVPNQPASDNERVISDTQKAAAKIILQSYRSHAKVVQVRGEWIKTIKPPVEKQWTPHPNFPDLLRGPIIKGPHGPKAEISVKTIEKVVANLVEAKDSEGLRRLANILFTGPASQRKIITLQKRCPSVAELVQILRQDPDRLTPADFQKLKQLFVPAVNEWRSGDDQRDGVSSEAAAKENQQERGVVDSSVDTFDERINAGLKRNIGPDDEIEITHGGGEWHILEFLQGKAEGYPLERGGVGIQVSPHAVNSKQLSGSYARDKAHFFFDRHAVLSAKIAAKHLTATPSEYEAGLMQSRVGYLKEVKVKVLDTGVVWMVTKEGKIEQLHKNKNPDLPS